MPLPGVEVGDIGTKMGYNSMDNGFLKFNELRIPKENMLSRFAGIDAEGNFEVRGDLRSLYMTMVGSRISIILGAFGGVQRATLIATRYAACRRQFANQTGSEKERKLKRVVVKCLTLRKP